MSLGRAALHLALAAVLTVLTQLGGLACFTPGFGGGR